VADVTQDAIFNLRGLKPGSPIIVGVQQDDAAIASSSSRIFT
jgi:hypothetical protein